jgi:hypothetical protein
VRERKEEKEGGRTEGGKSDALLHLSVHGYDIVGTSSSPYHHTTAHRRAKGYLYSVGTLLFFSSFLLSVPSLCSFSPSLLFVPSLRSFTPPSLTSPSLEPWRKKKNGKQEGRKRGKEDEGRKTRELVSAFFSRD